MNRFIIFAFACFLYILFASMVPTQEIYSSDLSQPILAMVKMADGSEVKVMNIKLVQRKGGHWLSAEPTAIRDSMYFTMIKSGVELQRVVPFSCIQSIYFKVMAATDHDYRQVIEFTILFRDSVRIVYNFPFSYLKNSSVTITQPDGTQESYKSNYGIYHVTGSKEYPIGDGFTGKGIVDGEQGAWRADFADISRIDFK